MDRVSARLWLLLAAVWLGTQVASAAAPTGITPMAAPPAASVMPLSGTYVFTATVRVAAPLVAGQGPEGLRRFIPITGGTVSGPMFTGKVLEGSGDWQIVRTDNVITVEARYILEDAAGIRLAITNRGLRDATAAVTERMMRGDPVAPSEYYFRTVAQIEAPIGSKYEWMNRRLFIGVAERKADAAVVHFYRLE